MPPLNDVHNDCVPDGWKYRLTDTQVAVKEEDRWIKCQVRFIDNFDAIHIVRAYYKVDHTANIEIRPVGFELVFKIVIIVGFELQKFDPYIMLGTTRVGTAKVSVIMCHSANDSIDTVVDRSDPVRYAG